MGRPVKKFSDGFVAEYDHGQFDKWCVYLTKGERKHPPKDVEYFTRLSQFAEKHGAEKLYNSFVEIYDRTNKNLDMELVSDISEIVAEYGNEALSLDKIFTVIYMGMVAEENKAGTKLGKRIKRLGMHVLLIEGKTVNEAANFMRGMKWRQIDELCKERGF